MPRYRFTGPYPTTYPETRDATGRHLGTVQPGDERDFETAPDRQWAEAGEVQDDMTGEDTAQDPAPGVEGGAGEPQDQPDDGATAPDPQTEPGD